MEPKEDAQPKRRPPRKAAPVRRPGKKAAPEKAPVAAQVSLPVVSVILPTFNEHQAIGPLIVRILDALSGVATEIIVVDDASLDGTTAVVQELAERDTRVRLLSRPRKMGLAGAVFAGVETAQGEYLCVMDADSSHDPADLSTMLARAQEGYDLVIGSRYAPGGGIHGVSRRRRVTSKLISVAARILFRLPVPDVMTGYVVCHRRVLADMPTHFSSEGFKFLFEVLTTQPQLRVLEWPITFNDRVQGSSNASAMEVLQLALLTLRVLGWKASWRLQGVRR